MTSSSREGRLQGRYSLGEDTGLDSIRGREDFKKLLAEIETKPQAPPQLAPSPREVVNNSGTAAPRTSIRSVQYRSKRRCQATTLANFCFRHGRKPHVRKASRVDRVVRGRGFYRKPMPACHGSWIATRTADSNPPSGRNGRPWSNGVKTLVYCERKPFASSTANRHEHRSVRDWSSGDRTCSRTIRLLPDASIVAGGHFPRRTLRADFGWRGRWPLIE